MGRFAFNCKDNSGINVGSYNPTTDQWTYIGMLYSYEHFVELSKVYSPNSYYSYYNIQYVSPIGAWTPAEASYSLGEIDYWDERPWGNNTNFNGIPAISFKMVESSNYYDENANYLGVIPNGSIIYCEKLLGGISGATHKDWLRICGYYYGGNYISVPNNCAFVDTGIDSNSTSPRVRGSW
jgi:hypothetical protein